MNVLKKINYLFDKKTKLSLIGIFLLIIIGSAAELAGVAIVLPIINLAVDDAFAENEWCIRVMKLTGYTTKEEVISVLIGITIFIYIFKSIYLSWMNSTLYGFAAKVKRELATRLMQAYLKQPYEYFLKKDTSILIRSINADTCQLYEVILNCLLVASNGVTAVALLVTLVAINPFMAILVAILLLICAVVILKVVQKRTRRYGRMNQQLGGSLIKYLQQSFEGIKEIKILGGERFFTQRYSETYREQTLIERKTKLVNLIPKYLIEAVCVIGIMVFFGMNIIYNPDYMTLIPQLATFVAAAYKLLPSVNAVYAYINTIIYHRASIDLVYHDIQEANKLEIQEGYTDEEIVTLPFERGIRLEQVDYKYENSEKYVLKNVSIEIPKGKSVAFIGPSGGGKTTTADLIIGLLRPTSGSIKVDGQDISRNLTGWRSQIGYIPQSIYLTDESIKCNVALGVEEANIDVDRVRKALEEAQLLEFADGLEKGIDTRVGERGMRLSGGQRQRIGIARALYHNPDLLVFDEATSALDNETEKEVMKAIDGLRGNKTIVMIAHRLSTIENCDIVYRVEQGKISTEKGIV